MHPWLILALASCLPLSAAAGEMVIGLYGVGPAEQKDLPKIREAGFNAVQTYVSQTR